MKDKKAGVVVDKYKLEIFRKNLKNAGFEWEETDGVTEDTKTLMVKFDPEDFDALNNVVMENNQQARRWKS